MIRWRPWGYLMASENAVKEAMAMIFLHYSRKRPPTQKAYDLLENIWTEGYQAISDEILIQAARKFVIEDTEIFDNQNPFARVRELALLLQKKKTPDNVVPLNSVTPEMKERNIQRINEILSGLNHGIKAKTDQATKDQNPSRKKPPVSDATKGQ